MRARLFGIAVGEQLHRALEVGEQDGHLLALAFEGATGGDDPLGEVLRGVCVGRRGARRRGRWRTHRVPAVETEPCIGWQLGPTLRAGQCEAATTLQAESRLGRVVVLAARTLHARVSRELPGNTPAMECSAAIVARSSLAVKGACPEEQVCVTVWV